MAGTVVIGLGNPILSDDSVGIKVARMLGERHPGERPFDIKEAYAGGIRLMDEMVGYDRAFIIDSLKTGNHAPGTIVMMEESTLGTSRNSASMHDVTLPTALEMGRLLGVKLPHEIRICGIEASEVETFGETLTPEVAEAVYRAVSIIEEGLLEGAL